MTGEQVQVTTSHQQPKEGNMLTNPTPGRMVEYTLSESDAKFINRRRDDAARDGLSDIDKYVLTGNRVSAGETYPMVIVRVTTVTAVNGQVMLDGTDTLWITSVVPGDGEGRWRPYPWS